MRFKITFLFIFLLACSKLFAQFGLDANNWQLLWSDEFDSINTNIWKIANNFDHYGNEQQVYISKNVTVDSGLLILNMLHEEYQCPDNYVNQWFCSRQNNLDENYAYTSGWIETKPNYYVRYGLIEARIKIPYSHGFFPAFWTFTNVPNYQEIDIFEMLPGRTDKIEKKSNRKKKIKITHNQYYTTSNMHLKSVDGENYFNNSLFKISPINDYTKWHTYSLIWSPSKIIWLIDGHTIRSEQNSGFYDFARIIFNFALNPWITPYNNSDFPSKMLIDYVRVYEMKVNVRN